MTAKIKELVAASASLEEVRDRLIDLYGGLNSAALAAIMQQAFVAAEMSGRFEVMP
jgi:phage gp29-like protein